MGWLTRGRRALIPDFSPRGLVGVWSGGFLPDGAQVLSVDDAIAELDNGEIRPGQTVPFPDTGVRALPDELVDRMFHPRSPPPWLELVADKLGPVVHDEVRAPLKRGGRV